MRKTLLVALAAVSAVVLVAVLAPWSKAQSQRPQDVVVLNMPEVLKIAGEVEVLGTVQHSETVRRTNVVVPPVERRRTTDLIELEAIETDGFTQVTLSLHGAVRGTIGQSGEVGAILVPDETSVLEILREKGIFHFPVEVKVSPQEHLAEVPFSVQKRLVLGFPRYRVFLYNSTDRTVDAHLFAYLTN
jgi:hypothetical protein